MLRKIDFIAAQADADAIRLIDLGAESEKVKVTSIRTIHVQNDIILEKINNIINQLF
jgi:3-deoxy-D-manno-octulosonic-acid transferase